MQCYAWILWIQQETLPLHCMMSSGAMLERLWNGSNRHKVMIVPWSLGPCSFSPRSLLPPASYACVLRLPVFLWKKRKLEFKISQWISWPEGCGLLWMGANEGVEAHQNQGKLVTAVCRVVVFEEKTYKKYRSMSQQLGNTMAGWNTVCGNWHEEFIHGFCGFTGSGY